MDDLAAHAALLEDDAVRAPASSKQTLAGRARPQVLPVRPPAPSRPGSGGSGPSEPASAEYLTGVGDEMSRMSPDCYDDMIKLRATRDIYELNSEAAATLRAELHRGRDRLGPVPGATNARFLGEAVWLLIEGILHGVLLERTGLTSGQAYNEIGTLVLNALTNQSEA